MLRFLNILENKSDVTPRGCVSAKDLQAFQIILCSAQKRGPSFGP